jgi:uncharacterized membrane protein
VPLRFVNPNYHVILIHYPLGVFVLGVILELLGLVFWRRSSARVAGRWMILIGALLSLPAATSGIYALADVARQMGPAKAQLYAERYAYLKRHVWVMSIASIVAVFSSVIWLAANNHWRRTLWLPSFVGVLIAWGLMTYGAWYGGETIYRQGTAVALIRYKTTTEDEVTTAKPALKPVREPELSFTPEDRYHTIVSYFIAGELQAHIIVSGFAFAAVIGAIGLSLRRMTTLRAAEAADLAAVEQQEEGTVAVVQKRRITDDVTVVRSLNPDAVIDPEESRLPVIRFWLLALLVVLATAVLGYWQMSNKHFFEPSGWHAFLNDIKPDQKRHLVHLILGLSLAAIALLFMIIAVAMPRRPFPLLILSSLAVLVIAAQVWVGVFLTFDDEGPLLHFNKTDEQTESPSDSSEGSGHHHDKGKTTTDSQTLMFRPTIIPRQLTPQSSGTGFRLTELVESQTVVGIAVA